jgi:hypothetical protein
MTPSHARAQFTWGPTVVVEVVLNDALAVYVKASSAQNVHTESEVITHAPARACLHRRCSASGPIPDCLVKERWMITRAASGVSLQQIGLETATTERTLTELADLYASLHRVTLPGFGPLADDGEQGVFAIWSQWQRDGLDRALDMLETAGRVTAGFANRVRAISAGLAHTLDDGAGSLLHADLGDAEPSLIPTQAR